MIGSIRRSRQIMASRSHLQIVTRPAKPKGIDAPVTYRKEGAIVSGGASIDHSQSQIVQYKPFLVEMNRKHCMIRHASEVVTKQNAHVIEGDSCFMESEVFQKCIVLAVTCLRAQGF